MALKLRRQAEMITTENLPHRNCWWQSDWLGTGAASFKRVLGRRAPPFTKAGAAVGPRRRAFLAPSHPESPPRACPLAQLKLGRLVFVRYSMPVQHSTALAFLR